MKQSPLTTVLLVLLVLSALASIALCLGYISNVTKLRRFQAEAAAVNNNRAIISALATDALEYSKKNQAIDPILEAAGVKAGKTSSAPVAPKPAGK